MQRGKTVVSIIVSVWLLGASAQEADLGALMKNTFDQVRSQMSEYLLEFDRAKDPGERFLRASMVHSVTQGGTFRDYPSVSEKLTATQKNKIALANQYYDSTIEAVNAFESSLSKEEISLITAEESSSIFASLGGFSSRWNFGVCDEAKFQALKRGWKGKDFYDQSLLLRAWSMENESKRLAGYFSALLKQLDAKLKAQSKSEALLGYYQTMRSAAENPEVRVSDHSMEWVEKKLRIVAGKEDFVSWARAWVVRHPECLLSADEGFSRLRNLHRTQDVGHAWLSKVGKGKKKPANCRAAQDQIHQDDLEDAWDHPYLLEWKEGGCRMYSTGEDLRSDADDIEIGVLAL